MCPGFYDAYANIRKLISIGFEFRNCIHSYNIIFLKLNPTTGRKHQIRKQLFIRNHPVLGDDKYNYPHYKFNKKNKLMLHAYKLNFFIDNKKYELIAEISDDF